MCYRIVSHVIRHVELPPGPKLVLAALADRTPSNGFECFIGQRALASQCGMSERAVRDHIADLEARGYVERTRRQSADGTRLTDGYRLHFHSEPADSAGSEGVIANRQISRREPANSANPHMYEASNEARGRDIGPTAKARIGNEPHQIDTAGRRHGLAARPGESWEQFRQRIERHIAEQERERATVQ